MAEMTYDQYRAIITTMAPEPTPRETFEKALQKGAPAFLDDCRMRMTQMDYQLSIRAAVTQDCLARIVAGDTFTARDSMRYPSIQQSRDVTGPAIKAALIGMLARTASYLRANVSFADEAQYEQAYAKMWDLFGDFSLADFAMVMDGIMTGKYITVNYRFLLPELIKACEVHADLVKVDQRERLRKEEKLFDQNEQREMLVQHLGVRAEGKERAKRQMADRVKWMSGQDVLTWADKAKLAARDSARRNGDEQ